MSKTWVFLWKKFGRQKARIKITRYSQRLTDGFSIFCCSLSECYFAGKGAALVLPPNERARPSRRVSAAGCDIQQHLQSMFYLLRPEETLKMVSYRQHKLMYLVSCISKVHAFWKLLQRDTTKVSCSSFFPNELPREKQISARQWLARVDCTRAYGSIEHRPWHFPRTKVQGWNLFYPKRVRCNRYLETARLSVPIPGSWKSAARAKFWLAVLARDFDQIFSR